MLGFTREQLVKPVVFCAVLEVCVSTCLQSYEFKFVIIFCDFFLYPFEVNMSLSGADTQDFRPAPRPNARKAHFRYPTGPAHPSRP